MSLFCLFESSNINEVIKAVLSSFFLQKNFTRTKKHEKHQNAPKNTKAQKKHKNTTKQKHKTQISEQKR